MNLSLEILEGGEAPFIFVHGVALAEITEIFLQGGSLYFDAQQIELTADALECLKGRLVTVSLPDFSHGVEVQL